MDFVELWHQYGVSHQVRREGQGASRVAPGKSGLHAHGEVERIIALESCWGIRPQYALKKDSRGLSRVAAGNPVFPQLVPVTSGRFSWCF